MISLDALESASRTTFDVEVGKDSEGSPVGFRVLGTASEEYQQAERAAQIASVQVSAARRKAVDMETEAGAAEVVDSANRRADRVLEACVVDWFGFGDGEATPFSVEGLRRVLKARPAWRDVILAAIEDDGNFTKGLLKPS